MVHFLADDYCMILYNWLATIRNFETFPWNLKSAESPCLSHTVLLGVNIQNIAPFLSALKEKIDEAINRQLSKVGAASAESTFQRTADFIASQSWTDFSPVILTATALIFVWMSWSQRLSQFSGRWSPFARSPITENGPTQVSDADFSYITADDLRNGAYDRDSGQRDTDLLKFKNKRTSYHVHFPAYSIDRGELTIGDVRDQAAKKIGCDPRRLKMLYKGKTLKDDARSCREEGLREGVDVMCVTSDGVVEPPSSSDSEEEAANGEDLAADGQPKRKRNRNRNKKKKNNNKKRGDDGESSTLAVPGNEGSRTPSRAPSPIPPATPATPIDKLNAYNQVLQSLIPQCDDFISHPPTDPAKRDFDYKRLSETILAQVLLKLDGVETDDVDARARRKELVKEAQRVLNALDAAK
ncbi:hypothetical protein K461DRAFT_322287 [Myriangium duriaei CBS 260.36]|uniref:BAG domain-containing protein n=1 Tax=Myriangium duriaei CBS 260.36 TaxID=1168546 RepID=A0A9P4IYF4_9PEZI|nr:hypothetical protein K461DRAFT_322287 [Myriangium duriaei CBS 260.36]